MPKPINAPASPPTAQPDPARHAAPAARGLWRAFDLIERAAEAAERYNADASPPTRPTKHNTEKGHSGH